jgi:hypothetical protein
LRQRGIDLCKTNSHWGRSNTIFYAAFKTIAATVFVIASVAVKEDCRCESNSMYYHVINKSNTNLKYWKLYNINWFVLRLNTFKSIPIIRAPLGPLQTMFAN